MRAYLRFRREPALQERLAAELAFLRMEAAEIATLVEGAGPEQPIQDDGQPQHAAFT
jgi:hypothetical protein